MNFPPQLQALPPSQREQVTLYWEQFRAAVQAQGLAFDIDERLSATLPAVWAASAFVAQACIHSPSLLSDLNAADDLQRRIR